MLTFQHLVVFCINPPFHQEYFVEATTDVMRCHIVRILQDDFFNYMHNAGYTDVERGERGSTEEHLTVTQFKVQREQERLDNLTSQIDQKEQSLARTSTALSKKEKELAAVQKKATLTKEALIHARDLDYIGKRTFLGNYSLTEEEFSKLKNRPTTAI